MSLHCLFAGLDSCAALDLLRIAAPGDAVLFFGTATRVAEVGHPALERWLATGASLHVITGDAALHGVTQTDPRVLVATQADFLQLSLDHERQLAWR